ncbi:hypothetical protein CRUP_030661 [Coryphaenoides rupestris]|nr:hypothetical protein CRUP_030661 [Coryphaenoides rupestris]
MHGNNCAKQVTLLVLNNSHQSSIMNQLERSGSRVGGRPGELSAQRGVLKLKLKQDQDQEQDHSAGMLWVFFIVLSYHQDRDVGVKGEQLGGAKNDGNKDAWFAQVNGSTLCATMSVMAGGRGEGVLTDALLYRVSDGRRAVRSVVTPRGDLDLLVDCAVVVDRARVKSFVQACRRAKRQAVVAAVPPPPPPPPPHRTGVPRRLAAVADSRFVRLDEAVATCREFERRRVVARMEKTQTQPQPQPRSPATSLLRRSKRGFTYPGTLWCGAGNMADNDDDLGEFAETDSCCRTHDHCPHVIHAFSTKYGHTNFKWHSICHCDCDIAMKQCLRKVNDTASRVVGQAFFNVIGVPCFEFAYEDHCAERHWYGLCKRYEKVAVAVPQPVIPYDFGGIDIIDVLTLAPRVTKNNNNGVKVDEAKARQEESTTPSGLPVSRTGSVGGGPEVGKSSLVTMVTAAEDFIKVLATVSTSQGSPVDTAAKGATPTAEEKKNKKKNRKNTGKRKKSQGHGKGKGRGRKVKLHTDAGVEDVLVASSSKVADGNNFIIKLKAGPSGHGNKHRFVGQGGLDLAGQEGASNEVMKDEPAADKEAAAEATSPSAAAPKERPNRYHTTSQDENLDVKEGKEEEEEEENPQKSQGRFDSFETSVTTARTPDVTALTKRNRSEEGPAGDRGEKRRKLANTVPIVSVRQVPTEERVKSIGGLGVLIASSIPPTKSPEPKVSRWPEMYGAKSVAAVTSAQSRGIQVQHSGKRGGSQHGRTGIPSRRSVSTQRATRGAGGGTRKQPSLCILDRDASPAAGQATHESGTRHTTRSRFSTVVSRVDEQGKKPDAQLSENTVLVTTTRAPSLSPMQLTLQRVQQQFDFKKRRKALLFFRQQ